MKVFIIPVMYSSISVIIHGRNLTQAGMLKSIKTNVELGFCTACFDGDYPIDNRYLSEEE